ncbi:MAG: protein-L-isoaspartate(D-aspartate) O-methyltransferase [Bacteroidales bacterium]|nr:protein-L-isoaspartate(D-aspartate) O-methyltransferase [Bacteroidales bacterium]
MGHLIKIILILLLILSQGLLTLCISPQKKQEVSPENKSLKNQQVMVNQQDTTEWYRPRFNERKAEREEMVNKDIAQSPYDPVTDKKVLDAMKEVPRHKFVPGYQLANAYRNHPLSIGSGQTISQPLIVAHMTELLEIEPGDRILEIGTGSGYQAAVLSELTPHIFTIEIIEKLGLRAKKVLNNLGYKTIKVKIGDGYFGWEEHAPYDGIIVTCAPEEIPTPLIDQLKPGGRIIIPVGKEGWIQHLVVVKKSKNGKISEKKLYGVRFVPMTGKADDI